MARPEIKFGIGKIYYYQEPYEDRFFVIELFGGTFKISYCKAQPIINKLNHFLDKVNKYNIELDKDNK